MIGLPGFAIFYVTMPILSDTADFLYFYDFHGGTAWKVSHSNQFITELRSYLVLQ